MKLETRTEIKSLFPLFHLGNISEENRILLERELLTDAEILVEYLDYKRKKESAELLPAGPSPFLWKKLSEKFILRKKYVLPVSFGAAAVAALVFIIFLMKPVNVLEQQNEPTKSSSGILFDSSSELPASSNVL